MTNIEDWKSVENPETNNIPKIWIDKNDFWYTIDRWITYLNESLCGLWMKEKNIQPFINNIKADILNKKNEIFCKDDKMEWIAKNYFDLSDEKKINDWKIKQLSVQIAQLETATKSWTQGYEWVERFLSISCDIDWLDKLVSVDESSSWVPRTSFEEWAIKEWDLWNKIKDLEWLIWNFDDAKTIQIPKKIEIILIQVHEDIDFLNGGKILVGYLIW